MNSVLCQGIVVLLAMSAGEARAQTKQKYSFKTPPGSGKYTQQNTIDIGDVPGHQIRIYEVQYTYTTEGPVFDGVKVVEERSRGASDYINGSGHVTGYELYVLQNGDKIFSRFTLVTQTVVNADGSKKSNYSSVAELTGGTGNFRGIRGTLRTSGSTDFKTRVESQTEGEYWIEK
jgi:hypothetical protein